MPVSYPQTASIVLLPLELPNYAPRILVVGGSSKDQAGGGTPASQLTYLLDLTATNPTWTQETLSCPRVMPDAVLLPDGTVGIFNGAEVGIAGGVFGSGNAQNTDGKPQSPEIYNPALAIGSRLALPFYGQFMLQIQEPRVSLKAVPLQDVGPAVKQWAQQILPQQRVSDQERGGAHLWQRDDGRLHDADLHATLPCRHLQQVRAA